MIYLRHKFALPFYDRESGIKQEIENNRSIFSTAPPLYLAAIIAMLTYLTARYSVLTNFGEVEARLLHRAMALSFAFGTTFYPAINIYLNPIVNRSIEYAGEIRADHSVSKKAHTDFKFGGAPRHFISQTNADDILFRKICRRRRIALDNTAFPEFAGGVAHLLKDARVETLKEGITSVLNDKKWRAQMARDGVRRAADYDWRIVAQKYLDMMIPLIR